MIEIVILNIFFKGADWRVTLTFSQGHRMTLTEGQKEILAISPTLFTVDFSNLSQKVAWGKALKLI